MSDTLDGLVEAYNTETGIKTRVPADWLSSPVLGRNLRRTPLQVAADNAARPDPVDESSTRDQLEEFAAAEGIDVTDARVKADVWDAVSGVLDEGQAELAVATDPAAVVSVDEDPEPDQVLGQQDPTPPNPNDPAAGLTEEN